LREALVELVGEFPVLPPECMPILGWGLTNARHEARKTAKRAAADPAAREELEELHLVTLLAKALLAFALNYERESEVSLAIGANVLRVLEAGGVRVKELPALSGVSKESIAMAFTFLREIECIEIVEDGKAKRTKVARLTKKGMVAAENYRARIDFVEKDWMGKFGEPRIRGLREALESLGSEELMAGLEPYPEGWRASVPRLSVLPEFPMVLHRGGYPDGS
jgi:DNA-binding MarR family transcriptional regulator